MTNPLITIAQAINAASKNLSAQGLLLQSSCLGVEQQPNVNFSEFPKLLPYQTEVNNGIAAAQAQADSFLNTIQPALITNLSNICNYYQLQNAMPSALPPGATAPQWQDALAALQSQATAGQQSVSSAQSQLTGLHSALGDVTTSFANTLAALNKAVNGGGGTLPSALATLSGIDSDINAGLAGTLANALAVNGNAIVVATGEVAGFGSSGLACPLFAGGAAVLAAGNGSEGAAAAAFKKLNDARAALLSQSNPEEALVCLVTGIYGALVMLTNQVATVTDAAQEMQSAWSGLAAELANLSALLKTGQYSPAGLRSLFLAAVTPVLRTVLAGANLIKQQMAGLTQLAAPANTNIGDYAVQLANTHAPT